MKRIFLSILLFLALSSPAMAIVTYNCDSLTGGAQRSLDYASVNDLNDGDRAIVVAPSGSTNYFYMFKYDASGTTAENTSSHPYYVRPDSYVTKGVWYEVPMTFSTATLIRAATSSGIMITEDSGVTGIMVGDDGRVAIGSQANPSSSYGLYVYDRNNGQGLASVFSGATHYSQIQLHTAGTYRAQFSAWQPDGATNSGTTVVQLGSYSNNSNLYFITKSAAGDQRYIIQLPTGSLRLNTSGVTLYFGTGTASVWESDISGEIYTTDDAGNNTLQTSHDKDTNLPVFESTNSLTGEGQKINLGQFFIDAAAGKFANGFKPEDVSQYATFTPPAPPEVVKERLLAKEAKERELWKEHWRMQNTKEVEIVVGGKKEVVTVHPTPEAAEAAAVKGVVPYRPKWLKERAGLE